MRKNYIVFKGLWWNWIPVLVRSFSLKSIKERVLFWLGGDSFAVFTNLVNNFKWGKRAKEVIIKIMLCLDMWCKTFEGGGVFNFFWNIRIIFIRQQKPSNFFLLCYALWFHRPSRCLICDEDPSSRLVFVILHISPIAWVTATNISNTTEAFNGRMFQSVLKRKKLKEKIDGKVIAVTAQVPLRGMFSSLLSIWFDNNL